MELKIPPAVVFLVFAGLMYLLASFLPFGYFDFFGRYYLMGVLLFFAAIVAAWALFQFFRLRTTIDPTMPSKASRLVRGGIFAYSRNPMYLALLMVLLVWGIWLGNAFNTLLAAGFVAYMNRFQIIPEETALLELFGKEYRQYCLNVRRWF
ncbi:isoprenylcysteine carboxylmethyltransferase family protein [Zobellia galactanivorans]|uniref:methyltransferase family protein n=1 Tax=Zobellia galactanivorans (strain DSM 12802 / CCUG 47099 / CIP 106680 / NCIMB 13871 / Dsij) TaxID=63186 RepID=UPI001C074757|nr:isoprenylcysteine carboxylmethyltransferase family protein [Zobellia galactanivorans]MBU3027136.1 isoprenylcysteine carboxylmethyltransferase family protein [Zobellia galactanivorans]MDO6807933.1 isoprenylcysteine carboxylmethyltransferase family protein [Zobellia galactanivorans]